MITYSKSLAAAALLCLGSVSSAPAQQLADILSAEILPGWRTEQGTHLSAIRLQLSQGWKTYWRSPGEAGIPPEFDWQGSENLKAVKIHWPTPEVFDFNGMQSIGYDRELVLPVEIWPAEPQQPVRLATEVTLGVCKDICVQAHVGLDGILPTTGRSDPLIRAAMRDQPETARRAGVARATCAVAPSKRGLTLTTEIEVSRLGPDEVVVVETAMPQVWVSEAVAHRQGNRLIATTELIGAERKPFALDRSKVTITLLAGTRAVEIKGCTGA